MIVETLAIDAAYVAALRDDELALVATAREVRRVEFATGRALLHRLLQSPEPIGRAKNGAPALPSGFIGSLAHDRHQAVAAIGSADRYCAIGIDIEPYGSAADIELRDAVLRADDPNIDPVAAFVMKEAAYKAWSTLGGDVVGPLDIRLNLSHDRFTAEVPQTGFEINGTFLDNGRAWVAIAAVGRDDVVT